VGNHLGIRQIELIRSRSLQGQRREKVGGSSAFQTCMTEQKFDDVALRLRDNDDVAFVKRAIETGTVLVNGPVPLVAARAIPSGHKMP